MHRGQGQERDHRNCFAAFTLIELLIVIAIMVLLVGILLPSLNRAREDARRTVCLANLKHIGVGIVSYASENNDRGPAVAPPITTQSPRQLLSNTTRTTNLGRLWPQNLTDANVYHCPSQRVFDYSADLRKLGADLVAGSYAYAVQIPAGQSPVFSVMRHLAMVSDDFTIVNNDSGVGRYSHARGYNVLYSDGSATWYSDQDESIWKRNIEWDDETDSLDYQAIYPESRGHGVYGGYQMRDIFKVWHSFCYSNPDPFY